MKKECDEPFLDFDGQALLWLKLITRRRFLTDRLMQMRIFLNLVLSCSKYSRSPGESRAGFPISILRGTIPPGSEY